MSTDKTSVVSLTKCKDYEIERVADAVAECLSHIDGIDSILTKGKNVLVKPNLLSPRPPEEGVTTHPSVIEAIVRFAQERGCYVRIGDSHGGTERKTSFVWEKTGMKSVSEKTGAALVNFENSGAVMMSQNGKSYPIAKAALDRDVLINVPRLKTHMETVLTAGVKNMFGCVPGFKKGYYHRDLHTLARFSEMLMDICELTKPDITVMDAIVSMDGNGPAAGRLRETGLVMASLSPYSLDMGVAGLISARESAIPTIAVARRRRLGPGAVKHLEFVGDDPSDCQIKDFDLPHGGELPPIVAAVVHRALWIRPRIDRLKCTSCGDCMRNCPVAAIEIYGDLPMIDLRRCISCFCCQEMCPTGAVLPQESRASRMIRR